MAAAHEGMRAVEVSCGVVERWLLGQKMKGGHHVDLRSAHLYAKTRLGG